MKMDTEIILQKTREFVTEQLAQDASGHDHWHCFRVCSLAKKIAEKEKADIFIVQLAALLHDIADWKFHGGDEEIGPRKAKEFLTSLSISQEITEKIAIIIKEISFKGNKQKRVFTCKEAMVVQDADRLDALGAIGIARTFAYGGYKKRPFYNPKGIVRDYKSFAEYQHGGDSTIHHFYEKLLLLKDLMNTETGRKMAEERHQFMEQYLQQFFKEWEESDLQRQIP